MLGSASILFAVLVQVVFGDYYSPRCRAASENTTSFEAVASINGRYLVEYCFPYDPGYSSWEVTLTYFNKASNSKCNRNLTRILKGRTHSRSTENVNITGLDCSEHICLSLPVDLVFRGCYMLTNKLWSGLRSSEPNLSFHYANNNITSLDYYYEAMVWVRDFNHDETDTVSYYWDSMRVPISGYEVFLCNENVTQYLEEPGRAASQELADPCSQVSWNCSVQAARVVSCLLHARPGNCYKLKLVHQAPWTNGNYFRNLTRVASTFCQDNTSPPGAAGAGRWVWPAAGGAAAAALLAAAVVRERRLVQKLKKSRVLQAWLQTVPSSHAAVPSASSSEVGSSRRVLLLYAREEPLGAPLVDALKDLLELAAPGQVIDLHSSECIAAMAAGGAGWLRAALRGRTRVLLLQTPALALAETTLDTSSPPELCLPLVPGRALRRCPAYSDAALQYCARLLADSHLYTDRPYRKYYLATLSELPCESAAHVAPYRRYALPAAASLLLTDLAGPACLSDPTLSDKLARLQGAASDFARYVRDNPHYLAEQFVLL